MEDTTTSHQQQAPPPQGVAPPLVRPTHGRVIAGVAAGVADRLGIGKGWVRIAFVVATLFGGAGLVLYVVGWLAIPEEGEGESIAAGRVFDLEGPSRWVGVALIAVGGILVLGLTDVVRGELVWAAALILAGILLYRGEILIGGRSGAGGVSGTAEVHPPPPPPPGSPGQGSEAFLDQGGPSAAVSGSQVAETSGVGLAPPPPPPPATSIDPPQPPGPPVRRPRSILGRVTLAVMLIAVGSIALIDNAGGFEAGARHYVGALVGIAGLGLVVGAWFGRARSLIAVGLLLLPVLAVASVVRTPFSGEVGERDFRPGSPEAIRDEYRLGAGKLTIDLRGIEAVDRIVTVDASVGAGQLNVIVPQDAAVSVDSRVGFGELDVLGRIRSGIGRDLKFTAPAGATSYFDLRLEVGFGQVRVIETFRDGSAIQLPPFENMLCDQGAGLRCLMERGER